MSTKEISLLLLFGRLFTVLFVSLVIRLQVQLVKQNRGPELQWYRKSLLALTIVLLVGNFVPIVIDSYGILGKGSFGLLLLYVFSNNITAMIAAFITWFVYHMAGKQ